MEASQPGQDEQAVGRLSRAWGKGGSDGSSSADIQWSNPGRLRLAVPRARPSVQLVHGVS